MGDYSAVTTEKISVMNKVEHLKSYHGGGSGAFEFDARIHSLGDHSVEAGDETMNLILRDQGHFVTAIVGLKQVGETAWKATRELTPETIVRVSGVLVLAEALDVPTTHKLRIHSLVVLAQAATGLHKGVSHGAPGDEQEKPLSVDALTLTERLNNRVLDVRVAATGAIFKLMSGIFELTVEHHIANGFQWVSTPQLVSYKIDGDDDYFPVSYFDRKNMWLAQTAEFHQQMALSMDFPRVFEVRSMFRAENDPNSRRRLAEFTGLEITMALENEWHEVVDAAEAFFIFVIRGLQERSKFSHLIPLIKRLYSSAGDFTLGVDANTNHLPRITFTQAKRLLRERGGIETRDEDDFTAAEESLLGKLMRSTSSPYQPTDVFIITEYPSHIRSFQIHPNLTNPAITNSFDFILRGQESSTGYQQIHEYKMLRAAMASREPPLDPDSPMWRPYVSSFEAGMHPHGNYGVGLNRLLQGFLGLDDIHEVALFPRDSSRSEP